jgi:hypothetical protein
MTISQIASRLAWRAPRRSRSSRFLSAIAALLVSAVLPAPGSAATVTVDNQLGGSATGYLGFTDWGCYAAGDFPGCAVTKENPNICAFALPAGPATKFTFGKGCKVSFVISVDKPPWGDCPLSMAEFTLNGAGAMDTYDVSLVNAFSVGMGIVPSTGTPAGPATSGTGNQKNTGVFPVLCDACAAIISPPTWPSCPRPNPDRCHGGTQYDPKPPCQLSQPTGADYTVDILAPSGRHQGGHEEGARKKEREGTKGTWH